MNHPLQRLFQHILRLWRRLLSLMGRGRFEREMEEEIRFHLEIQIEQNLEAGMATEEAHYGVLLAKGQKSMISINFR